MSPLDDSSNNQSIPSKPIAKNSVNPLSSETVSFVSIERVKRLFIQAGHPVISVDAKKKELIGNFKNPGRSWPREAEAVDVHDFPSDAITRTTPYGIDDLIHNLGYVYVGISADTPEFAVDAMGCWWHRKDRPRLAHENRTVESLSCWRQ